MSKILPSADNTDVLGQSSSSSLTSGASEDLRWDAVLYDVDVEGRLLVKGNLTVEGTTLSIETTNTAVTDTIIDLNSGHTGANTKDIGILMERGSTGDNAAIIWDESETHFVLGTTTGVNTDSTLNVTAGTLSAKIAIPANSAFSINDVMVTATAAELNLLDGVTSTTAELNILDGVTSTTAELNILDGVTATAAELNILDGVTSTAAELNILDGVTSTATEINLLDGVTSTTAEINIVDGDTTATSTTLADADRLIVNDDGTMVQVAMTDFETYFETSLDTLSNVTTVGALDSGSITSGFGSINVGASAVTTSGTLSAGNIKIGGVDVTSTAAELNILDGVTSTAAELNILDGVTASATEINLLDGVTATTAELNILDGVTSTAAELNILDGVTASATELNLLDGVTATTGELNILDGVTSTAAELNILDGVTATAVELNKLDGASATTTELNYLAGVTLGTSSPSKVLTAAATTGHVIIGAADGNQILQIASHDAADGGLKLADTLVTASAAEINLLDGSSAGTIANGKGVIYGTAGEVNATTLQIAGVAITATAAEINILDGVTSTAAELNILDGVTATAAELNILDGVTSTAAELNILDGVTSTTAELNILDGVTSTAAELNILDGVTSTAAELNIVDGNTSATSTTLADADRVVVNDNGTMVQVALTDFETYFETSLDTLSNVTTVGALNAGSITSGFGSINVGDSTITTSATISAGILSVDSLRLDGTTIGHADDTDILTLGDQAATFASDVDVNIAKAGGFQIGGVAVNSTAAELNILDGVTATAAELNILDGVTATAAELSILSGVTATAGELNILDGVTSTTAELNILDGVTSTAAELNILDGVTSTAAEINILDGDTTASSVTLADADRVVVNDAGTMKQVALTDFETYFETSLDTLGNVTTVGALNSGSITSGFGSINVGGSAITTTGTATAGLLAVDSLRLDGTTIGHADDTDILTLGDQAATFANDVDVNVAKAGGFQIAGVAVNSTAAELNILDGVTATATELNILDGVTATTAELNILDGVTASAAELSILEGVTSTATELNILDGVTSTTAELNIVDGDTSATSTTLADADRVVVNDNGTMVQVALTDFETYFETSLDTLSNVTTVGALNSGSITSGFGSINVGDSAITTTGTATAGLLSVDNLRLNGTTIGHADDTDILTLGDQAATFASDVDVNVAKVGGLQIGGVAVNSTAAELNILDGVTATATEINLLDGVTSTTAELNILDGVTSTAAELNKLDGAAVTTSELDYLAGVTLGQSANSKAVTAASSGNVQLNGDLTIAAGGNIEIEEGNLTVKGNLEIEGAASKIIFDDSLLELNRREADLSASRDLGFWGYRDSGNDSGLIYDGTDNKWKFFNTTTSAAAGNNFVNDASLTYLDVQCKNLSVADVTATGTISGRVDPSKLIATIESDLDSGNVDLTKMTTTFETDSASTCTLPNGTSGQIKSFAMVTTNGDMVMTVTNPGWAASAKTITFSDIGDGCMLQFIGSKWYVIGNNGCTIES